MHKCLLQLGLVFAIALVIVQPGIAAQQNSDITRQELTNFDKFLDSHPVIDQDLKQNPGLVKDSAYLTKHPELKQFLDTHPGVREEIRENPNTFMKRENRFEKSGNDLTRPEVKNFDEFLDKHQAIDKELSTHPELVNDPAYLAKHPELNNFLNSHPKIHEDLAKNPRAFMHREKKFDKAEQKAERREERREERIERKK
jgi:hypothetical protein